MFGGCVYSLDSLVGVIPMLVFLVCWDDEKVFCDFVGTCNKIYQYHLTYNGLHIIVIVEE